MCFVGWADGIVLAPLTTVTCSTTLMREDDALFIVLDTVLTRIMGTTFCSFFEYSFYDPLSIAISFLV